MSKKNTINFDALCSSSCKNKFPDWAPLPVTLSEERKSLEPDNNVYRGFSRNLRKEKIP